MSTHPHLFALLCAPRQLDTNPPEFRRDLGELEYLDGDIARNSGAEADPDGLFAGF